MHGLFCFLFGCQTPLTVDLEALASTESFWSNQARIAAAGIVDGGMIIPPFVPGNYAFIVNSFSKNVVSQRVPLSFTVSAAPTPSYVSFSFDGTSGCSENSGEQLEHVNSLPRYQTYQTDLMRTMLTRYYCPLTSLHQKLAVALI